MAAFFVFKGFQVNRHTSFPSVPNLDKELDSIISDVQVLTGKVATTLPPLNQTPDNARFFIKQTDNSYIEYVKLEGSYRASKTYT